MSSVRFIIITVPPPELSVLLESARKEAATLSHSCAALAYPPHITMRTGAVVPEESAESFADGLRESLGAWRPFTIHARGFFRAAYSSADGKPLHMVAWKVQADPHLVGLHARLASYTPFQRRAQPVFEPHLTLAFEDITEEAAVRLLRAAEKTPQTFPPELSWPCTNVGLYRKNEFHWEPYIVFRTLESTP
jgi:2'-5' RNA ligase